MLSISNQTYEEANQKFAFPDFDVDTHTPRVLARLKINLPERDLRACFEAEKKLLGLIEKSAEFDTQLVEAEVRRRMSVGNDSVRNGARPINGMALSKKLVRQEFVENQATIGRVIQEVRRDAHPHILALFPPIIKALEAEIGRLEKECMERAEDYGVPYEESLSLKLAKSALTWVNVEQRLSQPVPDPEVTVDEKRPSAHFRWCPQFNEALEKYLKGK